MSSTTEESDWRNMSPRSRIPPPSLSHAVTARPSSHHPFAPEPTSLSLDTQNDKSSAFIRNQLESQLANAVTARGSQPTSVVEPTISTVSALADINGASHSASIQNTAEWEAARESVLSQMVTSQDIAQSIPPTAKEARGGVKTGGRRGRGGWRTTNTKIKIEPDDSVPQDLSAVVSVKTETPARGKNRGGRPRGSRAGAQVSRGGKQRGGKIGNRGGRPRGGRAGLSAAGALSHSASKKKRKRDDDDEDEGPEDTDVSEEFNLLAHTSSGRRVFQAKTFSPVVLDLPASSTKKTSPLVPRTASPPTTKKAKPKRRKPGEAAVCINCGRGHSPTGNQIVFCDGCNTPWHQYCHDRPITPSVIQIEEKEWLCSECRTAREEKSHIAGKVAAKATMTTAEKRTYLQSLENPELVSLLLHASSLHSDLPIFTPPPPTSIPTILEPRPLPAPIQSSLDEEEYIEIYVQQEPLPYPKAGNGLVLPPEHEDLALLIDEDVVSYSHSWKGTHGWEGPGGLGWGSNEPGGGGIAVTVGA